MSALTEVCLYSEKANHLANLYLGVSNEGIRFTTLCSRSVPVENLNNICPFSGFFLSNPCLYALLSVVVLLIIGYVGSPFLIWAIAIELILLGFAAPCWLLIAWAVVALIFLIKPVRRLLVSPIVMKLLAPMMPRISETERAALEAGVTWIEKDLFSGKPNLDTILQEPYPRLTAEEQAFMDGPVEKLCAMIDHWKVWKTREMDDAVWDFMKKEKFLGMIIPKEYGGLGFSAMAHSEVVMKISSRSVASATTVMVPNSLGPAELLIHYGTDEQKNHYLPRLARGEELPCFGLTEPTAGSDAGGVQSTGVVFKGEDGKLYLRLNWNKRWITLAAISTIIGLAFRLIDPDNLLGQGTGDLGITCALIPSNTKGVVLGRRHDPLGVPFYNCPTQGHDVIMSVDAIVGGPKYAGKGWNMLMECLAAGRGISLPSQATGGAKLATRVASAHSLIRQQFGVSIAMFEGVEEALARIFGFTYGLEAARRFTLGALDKGLKPGVVTAIQKYYSTELGRKVGMDAMDVLGGAGISMGPRNVVAEMYIGTPISITVEGANILTRTLMIFGQGALRAHPYAFKEVNTIEKKDLKGFDEAFWGHVGHITRNAIRALILSVTRGYSAFFVASGPLRLYKRRLMWTSATFAIMADIGMGTLGGSLKFREKITGRFADILGWMYIATATLRRWEADGRKKEDLAYARYVLKYAFSEIQRAFDGMFDNMYAVKQRGFVGKLMFGTLNLIFKEVVGSWSRINSIGSQASDHLQHVIVSDVLNNPASREMLSSGIYVPKDKTQALGRLENAMSLILKAQPLEKKVHKAVRSKQIAKKKGPALYDEARDKGVITAEEYALLKEVAEARWDAIQVDDFSKEEYHSRTWP
jgi:acyl-CoA dehydrogenase